MDKVVAVVVYDVERAESTDAADVTLWEPGPPGAAHLSGLPLWTGRGAQVSTCMGEILAGGADMANFAGVVCTVIG